MEGAHGAYCLPKSTEPSTVDKRRVESRAIAALSWSEYCAEEAAVGVLANMTGIIVLPERHGRL